jgi:two-component system response regulator FlrC
MEQGRILIVDDDGGMRRALAEVLGRGGFDVAQASSGEEGLARLGADAFDLVVSDLRMPGLGGLNLLREARRRHPRVPIILITAYGTVDDAVAAMKLGACDFLVKPFSPQDLLQLVRRALGAGEDRGDATPVRAQASAAAVGRPLVTRDPAMLKVLDVAESIASSRAPVLVEGESGTGKELLARFIHDRSPRRGKAFVAVNCAALPAELLESELFGHEKGAFTGAIARRGGKFELANGGTILLDEVGEMEVGLQAKLLRVLQEYEVDRVGGCRPIPVDVRVIATTNRRLVDLVEQGLFREDLYYRLSVIPLTLPPLRERPADLEPLIDHFLEKYGRSSAGAVTPEARGWMLACPWRGNVRELENTIERAVLLSAGRVIELADVEAGAVSGPQVPALRLAGMTVAEMERRLILETLRELESNRTRAARQLGISVRTLRNKLAEYRAAGWIRPGELAPGGGAAARRAVVSSPRHAAARHDAGSVEPGD